MPDLNPGSNTETIFPEKGFDAFTADIFQKCDQGRSSKNFDPRVTEGISSVLLLNDLPDLMTQTGCQGFCHDLFIK